MRRDRFRSRLLRKLLAVHIDRDRTVRVERRRNPKQALQPDLTRGRLYEVGAAHDMRDALLRIVDADRELIRVNRVAAIDHEIADMLFEFVLERRLYGVFETNDRASRIHAPRACDAPRGQPGAAGSGIDVAFDSRESAVSDLTPTARTCINPALATQFVKRGVVSGAAGALSDDVSVPVQPESRERAQDVVGCA